MSDTIYVVSPEECEAADLMVCVLKEEFDPTIFPDNLEAPCNDCGRTVVFRPYAPKGPVKVCLACVIARGAGGNA